MQKAFKRVFSLFLSIVLVLSTFAATGIQSFAAGNVATSKSGAYLMAYFTGQGAGEKIHFATSKDGYNFEPLNGNKAIIDPVGSGVTGHVRDPYVFRGQEAGSTFWERILTQRRVSRITRFSAGVPRI